MTGPVPGPVPGSVPASVPGPVEQYLDELFDRLSGTGAAGRRALTETEDHLRAAMEDGVASGLAPHEAELAAVARFGPVTTVAHHMRAPHRRRGALAAVSGGWLVAGIAVAGLGVTYLTSAVDSAVHGGGRQQETYYCVLDNSDDATFSCRGATSALWDAALAGLIVLLAGAVLLTGRYLARRRAGLPPTSRRFPAYAAVLFAVAGAVLVGWPPTDRFLDVWQGPGSRIALLCAGVAVLTAVGMAVWGLARRRRPDRPGRSDQPDQPDQPAVTSAAVH